MFPCNPGVLSLVWVLNFVHTFPHRALCEAVTLLRVISLFDGLSLSPLGSKLLKGGMYLSLCVPSDGAWHIVSAPEMLV